MESLRERLDELKRKQEAASVQLARAEARKEQAETQEAQILDDLSGLGVAPKGLDEEIERLGDRVRERLDEAAQILEGVES